MNSCPIRYRRHAFSFPFNLLSIIACNILGGLIVRLVRFPLIQLVRTIYSLEPLGGEAEVRMLGGLWVL